MKLGKHDSIMVVLDNLTKAMHFILANSTHKVNDIVKIFVKAIFRLHGLPKDIILDKDEKFTLKIGK